jgi:hypothetical protein
MALAEVEILPTSHPRSPRQLAILLDKLAKRKPNPVTGALLVHLDSEGNPGIAVANLSGQDMLELQQFLAIVLDNSYRHAWHQELQDEIVYEDDNV